MLRNVHIQYNCLLWGGGGGGPGGRMSYLFHWSKSNQGKVEYRILRKSVKYFMICLHIFVGISFSGKRFCHKGRDVRAPDQGDGRLLLVQDEDLHRSQDWTGYYFTNIYKQIFCKRMFLNF